MRFPARFDVLRQNKERYEVGVVSKVDFSGKIKRIQFHFPRLSSKFDEWIDFGSERIARLHTNVPKNPRHTKKAKNPTRQAHTDDHSGDTGTGKTKWSTTVDIQDIKVGSKFLGSRFLSLRAVDLPFIVEDAFDVYREGEKRASVGVVEQVESERILFHFSKTNLSEWHDFDKEKIRPYKRMSKDSGFGFSLKNARCPATVDEENMEIGGT